MQPVIGWKPLPLDRRLKSCSCSSEGSKVRLVALRCVAVAHFIAVSSASAQDPATVGQFSSVTTWPYKATHAHLLPTGKVLWWPSFDAGDNPTLWDPSTNTNTAVTHAGANIFCSGHAFLPNGQLLVAGGHIGTWMGLPNAYTYNPLDNTWTRLPDMNNGRWYPTNTTLPNGDMLVISGTIRSGVFNVEPQVWQSATGSWRNLTAAHLALPFYPFMFVTSNGQVFCAGPSPTTRYLDVAGPGAWSSVADSNYGTRNWGSGVMYDDGKVLIMGGSPCGFYSTTCTTYPTATAEIIDLNSPNPVWTYTGSMVTGGRKLHNATLLPDGKVLVIGGSRGTESANARTDRSSIRKRAVGSGNRDLDNNGELDKASSIPLNRGVAARRARFIGRRAAAKPTLGRNIFASLSVPRIPPNYHVSAHECCVRAVIFRGYTRRHQHFKRHTDPASFRDAWL